MLSRVLQITSAAVLLLGIAYWLQSLELKPAGRSASLEQENQEKTPKPQPSHMVAQAETKPAVLFPRVPASNEGLPELEGESSLRWNFKKPSGPDGVVTKMSEGRLFLGGATREEDTRRFLSRFGRNVLGFDSGTAGAFEVRQEEETTQVIVHQKINGLEVYGARGNFIYDAGGNLIYAVSDAYNGSVPSAPQPAISKAHAAEVARQALLKHLSAGGGADPASYSIDRFNGILMYRLVSGSISLVYRYELALAEPLVGDMEIMVDAELGVPVLLQNQTRK